MIYLFLDFDGVLNNKDFLVKNCGGLFTTLDPKNVEVFNLMISKLTNYQLVISSSWREKGLEICNKELFKTGYTGNPAQSVTPKLYNEIKIEGKPLLISKSRYKEIRCWLDKNKVSARDLVIIIDDDESAFLQSEIYNVINLKTNFSEGLISEHLKELESKL